MNLAIIPDEYCYDPMAAFELGLRWGIDTFEIRFAHRWRVPNGPAWVADGVVAAVKAYGVTVSAISPGLFKPTMNVDGSSVPISMDTPDQIRRHLDQLLPAHMALADRLATKNITLFALPRPAAGKPDDPIPAIVIDTLAQAAAQADAGGFTLFIENGGGMWADTGAATARLLRAVNAPNLKATWDPANVAYANASEAPVADGYPAIRPFVGNVHVKEIGRASCRERV